MVTTIWAFFLALHFLARADSDGFWFSFGLFGGLGPLVGLVTSTRGVFWKRKYFRQGADVRSYTPLFVHRAGLLKPSKDEVVYIAALQTAYELIFFRCDESLCKEKSDDFFEDLNKEVARVPFRAIQGLYVIPAEIDVEDRRATQVGEFLTNKLLGPVFHRSVRTIFFDAFIVIVLAGNPQQPLVFGLPNKFSGSPIFSTLLEFVPEVVATTCEKFGTASEIVEALKVEPEDPVAVRNAKQVAIEILAMQARSAGDNLYRP